MKYLDYITGIINAALAEATPCLLAQMLGVAVLAKRKDNGGKDVMWPVQYDATGEGVSASPDDDHDWCSYHRSLSLSTQRMPGGYGDGMGYIKLLHRMSLVVWAKQTAVNMRADELALLLHFAMPDALSRDQAPQNFQSVNFNITDVVLNSEQVFGEEFKNVDHFIKPEHILLKVNYTIESIVSKRCFNTLCGKSVAA